MSQDKAARTLTLKRRANRPFSRNAVKNTASLKVGRLVEVRVGAGYRTIADVDALFNAITAEVSKLDASRLVVVAVDWRQCPLMSADAADHALLRMIRSYPRTERSAALASRNSPLAVMQFMRLIKDSHNGSRRLFYDRDEMVSWLSEVLSPVEAARLRAFLLEQPRASTSGARAVRRA